MSKAASKTFEGPGHLGAGAHLVLVAIASHANPETGVCESPEDGPAIKCYALKLERLYDPRDPLYDHRYAVRAALDLARVALGPNLDLEGLPGHLASFRTALHRLEAELRTADEEGSTSYFCEVADCIEKLASTPEGRSTLRSFRCLADVIDLETSSQSYSPTG